jgi:hypothetical protein
MGMDLYGLKPTTETGTYFRNSVWYWRPLANYIAEVAPYIYASSGGDTTWHFNDGRGLTSSQAKKLATLLASEIESGNTAAYAVNLLRHTQSLPDVECTICNGTGHRNDAYVQGTCNACEGKGHRRPLATLYFFEVENVQAFVTFAAASGGFKIW